MDKINAIGPYRKKTCDLKFTKLEWSTHTNAKQGMFKVKHFSYSIIYVKSGRGRKINFSGCCILILIKDNLVKSIEALQIFIGKGQCSQVCTFTTEFGYFYTVAMDYF